jgi:hypothetical protein
MHYLKNLLTEFNPTRFLSSLTKAGMESRIDRKLFPRKAAAGVPHHGIKTQNPAGKLYTDIDWFSLSNLFLSLY